MYDDLKLTYMMDINFFLPVFIPGTPPAPRTQRRLAPSSPSPSWLC